MTNQATITLDDMTRLASMKGQQMLGRGLAAMNKTAKILQADYVSPSDIVVRFVDVMKHGKSTKAVLCSATIKGDKYDWTETLPGAAS